MKQLFSRAIIGFALANLVVQLVIGWFLVKKLDTTFSLENTVLAVIFEVLAFLVLTPYMKGFYAANGIKISSVKTTQLIFMSEGFSRLVPLGDYFLQRFYFKKVGYPVGPVLGYIVVLYSFAILSLILMFLICQFIVTFILPNEITNSFLGKFAYIPFAFTALFTMVFILRKNPAFRRVTKNFFRKYFKSIIRSPFEIVRELPASRAEKVRLLLPLSVTWMMEGFAYAFCIYAFGASPPLILIMYVYFFVKLFRFVPIFPAGIGEIEAVSLALFAAYGFPAIPIIAGATLFKLISYWLPILIGLVNYRLLSKPA